ncbi:hypothetical protein [Streptomyces sp. NPDC052107]|uniref:hypothetical protein n=1 Tax=Streptomyces sp. NPDC052107 TaxID=3155632 RepID=UPI0034120E8B
MFDDHLDRDETQPLDGLTTPAGFTDTGFHWPPGTSNDGQKSLEIPVVDSVRYLVEAD